MSSSRRFATTRWSLVVKAGTRGSPELAELCERYWYPLYAFLRRQGLAEDDATEGVQGFLAQLLERGGLSPDADRGRFRSYLIGALKNFLAAERRAAATERRGGHLEISSIEFGEAEGRYVREPVEIETPERLFARRWALTVLDHARQRLHGEMVARGRGALFEALAGSVVPDGGVENHAAIASRLGMTEGAVKVAQHRLRRRMGELIREEVADTLSAKDQLEDEVGALMAALG